MTHPTVQADAVQMLDRWLTAARKTAAARGMSPDIAYAVRLALRHLARSGGNPALAKAMLAELDRRHPPQYVTAFSQRDAVTWHLVTEDGTPIEAGEYSELPGARFTITALPEVELAEQLGRPPRRVQVTWTDTYPGTSFERVDELVPRWCWRLL